MHLLNCNNNNNTSREFLHFIQTYSLISTIVKLTKITDKSATLIGNIFIKNPINDIFGTIINDQPSTNIYYKKELF